jgi:precorrin-6A/cobalt-precorrin-6A reductase
MKRILILGGTGDAAALTQRLRELPHIQVISSLAGRTQTPLLPDGPVRVGGFGGVAGLTDYLNQQQIDLVIDATHPFANQISWNAAAATTAANVARLMLIRPAWEKTADDNWIEVESHEAAAKALPELAKRVFLTIGRQELAAFSDLQDMWFLMRMIDPPTSGTVPPGHILLARGPFTLANEIELLDHYKIGAVVSKNSGGEATYAKIIAARQTNIPVVMVQRSSMPVGEWVAGIEEAVVWVKEFYQI